MTNSSVVLVDSGLLLGVDSVAVIAIAVAPLLSKDVVAGAAGALRAWMPVVGVWLARSLEVVASACQTLRERRQMLFVLLHGAFTYAAGDVLAQLSMQPSSKQEAGGRRRAVSWRPMQSVRAALVGIVSDTLPFYHWSLALSRTSASVAAKVAAHVAFFQPASTGSYLLFQPLFRGVSLRKSLAFAGSTFLKAFAPAFVSFLVGGVVVYSLPSVALQSALRNLGVLALSVYLAIVSS